MLLTHTEEKILNLLALGAEPGVVATAVGVTPAMISQTLEKEGFMELLQQRKFEKLSGVVATDEKYNKLEGQLQDKLESILPYMAKPSEVVRALQVVNAAKRRATEDVGNQNLTANDFVHIRLPANVRMKYTISPDTSQIIEVDGRSLATLPSKDLNKLRETSEESFELPNFLEAEKQRDESSAIERLKNLQILKQLPVSIPNDKSE